MDVGDISITLFSTSTKNYYHNLISIKSKLCISKIYCTISYVFFVLNFFQIFSLTAKSILSLVFLKAIHELLDSWITLLTWDDTTFKYPVACFFFHNSQLYAATANQQCISFCHVCFVHKNTSSYIKSLSLKKPRPVEHAHCLSIGVCIS